MKLKLLIYGLVSCALYSCSAHVKEWTVVGAGPAGLSVIGLLLDLGVPGESICWIDSKFNGGRLGEYYGNVPSNTQTKYFIEFIQCCKAFMASQSPAIEKLLHCDPEKEYLLQTIVEPLQDITAYLRTQVNAIQGNLQSLDFHDDLWHIGVNNTTFTSYNVVLATGSHPKVLNYETQAHTIPLDIALDKMLLTQEVAKNDAVAVIGSAHSAILILKYLSELPVKRIINFYSKPIQYAIPNPSGLINEANGLKGITARWAQEVLEKNPPANLIRIFNTPKSLEAWLDSCTKIIYAAGFERNELPPINGGTSCYDLYDSSSGVIAQRLFGIGIAFPEKIDDFNGTQQFGIGLNDFIEYAQRVLPQWMQKKADRFIHFNKFFMITSL